MFLESVNVITLVTCSNSVTEEPQINMISFSLRIWNIIKSTQIVEILIVRRLVLLRRVSLAVDMTAATSLRSSWIYSSPQLAPTSDVSVSCNHSFHLPFLWNFRFTVSASQATASLPQQKRSATTIIWRLIPESTKQQYSYSIKPKDNKFFFVKNIDFFPWNSTKKKPHFLIWRV